MDADALLQIYYQALGVITSGRDHEIVTLMLVCGSVSVADSVFIVLLLLCRCYAALVELSLVSQTHDDEIGNHINLNI